MPESFDLKVFKQSQLDRVNRWYSEGPTFDWKGRSAGPTTRLEADGAVFAADEGDYVEFFEKIVGPNNLRPIAFLERGLQLAASVAHITLPGVGSGTGFLIGRDVLLTNHHILDSVATARTAVIRFNYQDALDGTELPFRTVKTAPDQGFHTSPMLDGQVDQDHLDFTAVKLAEAVADDYGTIPLATDVAVDPPLDVVLIQHPGGQKKQIAIADNELVYADDLKCQYLTDTLPGSSGAPVFNERWQLIALHHAGGFYVQPGDPQRHLRKEGVRISAIAAQLPAWALN